MSSHSRKPSSRAALPRRATKGPLDDEGPLSPSTPSADPGSRTQSSIMPAKLNQETHHETTTEEEPPANPTEAQKDDPTKDLSFLLEPSIYHPLSQLEIPAPFRRPFALPPPSTVKVPEALQQIDSLIAECNYLSAAHLSAHLLTSGAIAGTDQKHIFRLLALRYSCLELSGQVVLAAQEAKALEDLSSAFYYHDMPDLTELEDDEARNQLPTHIMPFPLRLQAVRLQSIGFSDPRRGVSALYDIASECRDYLISPKSSTDDRKVWSMRLEEVGLRVVGALIEMGDLDCARRTLENLKPSDESQVSVWAMQKAMLCLKMGLISDVHAMIEQAGREEDERTILRSLLAVADDDYDAAVELLSTPKLLQRRSLLALAKQNLAVALLYRGEIQKARSELEELVETDESFPALTINLATVYDLSTDRSRDLKLGLADRVAEQQRLVGRDRIYTNGDFKL